MNRRGGLLLLIAVVSCSAAAPTPNSPTTTSWQALKVTLPSLVGRLQGPNPTQAKVWLGAADAAKSFATAHPGTADAAEAAGFEALYLTRAAEAGDTTQSAALADLVTTIRQDPTVPAHMRFLVASLNNRLAIEETPKLTHAQRLAAYEKSAREMIAAFPAEPAPYWALLNLARDAVDEAAGTALAKEVASMPGAPAEVRTKARQLGLRNALLGQTIDLPYLDPAGAKHTLSDDRNRPVVIYTWTAKAPGSIALAGQLSGIVQKDTIVIGLSLDADILAAQSIATAKKLPGQLVYALKGAMTLAQGLHVTGPGEVFLIDRNGILRSDRAQMDLASQLKSVEATNGGVQ